MGAVDLIVAVTQRVDFIPERDELRDSVDQRLTRWLATSGFLPVCVPNVLLGHDPELDNSPLERWLQKVSPGAVLLSGGNDVGRFAHRDATEGRLLSWAAQQAVPVLGICRGMQMMAIWGGAELHRVAGHVGTRHRLLPGDGMGALPDGVNSFHDWAVADCPEHFEVIARAEDGVIEAIRHVDLPWEGWMWHPERESGINPIDTERMQRLFGGR